MPIRDTRMMAKALEQRWPMSDNVRKVVVARLAKIVADTSTSPREATAAARALIAAEGQNQGDEHKFIDVSIEQRDAELDAIARDLGVTVDLVTNAQRQGGVRLVSSEAEELDGLSG